MGRLKKRGSSGVVTQYMTRSHAMKRLQVTLQDFRLVAKTPFLSKSFTPIQLRFLLIKHRKLCILKGIYPREPKRKFKGKNKTYYLAKDIAFLMHDPLLQKFRQKKTYRKKMKKAKGRGEMDRARRLQRTMPVFNLDHIIRER